MMTPPRGLLADLVTPLTADGRVDGTMLGRLATRMHRQATGVLVGSLTVGEARHLDTERRLDILRATIEAGGELVILFEITGGSIEETLELAAGAEALTRKLKPRAGLYYLVTPLAYHGNRDLPGHIDELGRITSRRIILANVPDLVAEIRPGPHHRNLRTSILKKISANEQVAGLAFSGDLARALNYQRAVKLRRNFRFYDLDEENFMERPSSSGLISGGAVIMPAVWMDVVGSSLNLFDGQRPYPDHLSQVWRSGQIVRELTVLIRSRPAAAIKTALCLMGLLPSARVTPDTPGLDSKEEAAIRDRLKDIDPL